MENRELEVPDAAELIGEEAVLKAEEKATDVEGAKPPIELDWKPPSQLRVDHNLLTYFEAITFEPTGFHADAVIDTIIFEPQAIERFSSPIKWLNDDCINHGAALLKEIFMDRTQVSSSHAQECALLSSFLLQPEVLDGNRIWRLTRKSAYWTKAKWILPIHDATNEHWVLAVIKPTSREIVLYDSFGKQKNWSRLLTRIHTLVKEMIQGAHRNKMVMNTPLRGWVAKPSSVRSRQSNSYDCGVWVLSGIAAVLRGFDIEDLREEDLRYLNI
ncbi:hypothetical protein MPER_05378 [Moniliophthora perniciosa FA553]|nr:hypothetical protein MPER_05378 [Moniliophthora perniciosa FA553]